MKDTVVGTLASTICGAVTGFLLGYFAATTLPETSAPVLNVAIISSAFFASVGAFVGAWLSYVKDENKNDLQTYAMIGACSSALVVTFLGWLLGVPAPSFSLASAVLFLVPGALQGMTYQLVVKYKLGSGKSN